MIIGCTYDTLVVDEINTAPTQQEKVPKFYKIRASKYFLDNLVKLKDKNVSEDCFEDALRCVIASHNASLFFEVTQRE
jgi:hypothetical protein